MPLNRSHLVRYTQFFLLVWLVLLVGCDRSSSTEQQKPYLMTQKRVIPHTKEVSETKAISRAEERITLSAMEAAHQEKMATIAAEKEKKLKALELEKTKVTEASREKIVSANNQKEIRVTQEKQKVAIALERERTSLYQQYLIAAVILFLVLMIILYGIYQKKHALKIKLHEEELRHQEAMLASKQQHERINKTLEILASDSTDKHLKKELVRLLKDQGNTPKRLPGS